MKQDKIVLDKLTKILKRLNKEDNDKLLTIMKRFYRIGLYGIDFDSEFKKNFIYVQKSLGFKPNENIKYALCEAFNLGRYQQERLKVTLVMKKKDISKEILRPKNQIDLFWQYSKYYE